MIGQHADKVKDGRDGILTEVEPVHNVRGHNVSEEGGASRGQHRITSRERIVVG